jgi:hypothetical protein
MTELEAEELQAAKERLCEAVPDSDEALERSLFMGVQLRHFDRLDLIRMMNLLARQRTSFVHL